MPTKSFRPTMGSLGPVSSADSTQNSSVPEIDDAHYSMLVLHLPPDRTEGWLDDTLHGRAQALGVAIPQQLPLSAFASSIRTTTLMTTPQGEEDAAAAQSVSIYHGRNLSDGSNQSAITESELAAADAITIPKHSKNLSFSIYDKYLAQIGPNLDQPKICRPSLGADGSAQGLLGTNTKKSLFSLKSAVKNKVRRKRTSILPIDEPQLSCICCRDEFKHPDSLHNLPCGHTYCADCLRVMATQATIDESKMPPRCCTQPIPSSTVKAVLDSESQQAFLKAAVQFSTPWESRIFCPNTSCNEFIPPRRKVDPKQPFNVVCPNCQARVCIMCKGNAHPIGKDCPEDAELDAVLRMGEKSGWRRCYKCRNLVELAQGCTHMTCRCKAQFCYICGGVWDATVGCPNFCNGEEELERRRVEEEERLAGIEAEKAAQEAARLDAERRTSEHPEFQSIKLSQEQELSRFQAFVLSVKDSMRARHLTQRQAMAERHADQKEKMEERHAKTVSHLEDRQIAAEMELRIALEQSEKSVKIRLKHMEAYCDGLGQSADSNHPPRIVTEQHLRELGQQYTLRDGMERLHQAKINVMRDRQAKRMEELLERQEAELERLAEKRHEDLEDLAARFANEEDAMEATFKERQSRMRWRWHLVIMILCKELEERDKATYALISPPNWPEDADTHIDAPIQTEITIAS